MDKKLTKLEKTSSEYLKILVLASRWKLSLKKYIFWTFHLICEMELIDLTKSQTIGFFKFIINQTTHQTSYSKLRIPYKRDWKNSSNEEIFNTAKCEYEVALKKIGFKVGFK